MELNLTPPAKMEAMSILRELDRRKVEERSRYFRPTQPPQNDQLGFYLSTAAIQAAFGGNRCLSGDVKLRLPNGGLKPIRDIGIGERILAYNCKTGIISPSKVLNKYDNGIKPVYKYRFGRRNTEYSLVATKDHKIWAETETWKVVKERPLGIISERRTAAIRPIGSKWGRVDERALLLGLLLGDGCLCVGAIQFTCADPSLIEDIKPYLKTINISVKQQHNPIQYVFGSVRKYAKKYHGSPSILRQWLRKWKLDGTNSHTKFIPQEVWGWNTESIKSLVAGLLVTDGSFFIGGGKFAHCGFTSCSKQLIYGLRDLMEVRLGIYGSTITEGDAKHGFKIDFGTHEALERISQLPLVGVKKLKSKEILKCSKKKHSRSSRLSFRGSEYIGELPTYDITIDHPDHLFVIEGNLVVSNSGKSEIGVAKADALASGTHPTLSERFKVPTRGRIIAPKWEDNIKAVILQKFRTFTRRDALWGKSFIEAWSEKERKLTYANGSEIRFFTYEQDINVFGGADLDWVWFDEHPPENIFIENLMRLADRRGIAMLTMTPEMGITWEMERIIERADTDPQIKVWYFRTYDNPHLSKEGVAEVEKMITDPAVREVKLEGKFVSLAGLVYPMYNPNIHYIPQRTLPSHWQRVFSINPHLRIPTTWNVGCWSPDGELFIELEGEFNPSAGGVPEMAQTIRASLIGKKIGLWMGDEAMGGDGKNVFGQDSVIKQLQAQGLPIIPTNLSSDKDFDAKVQKVRHFLMPDPVSQKPRLYVMQNCPNTHKEFCRWQFKTKTRNDEENLREYVQTVNKEWLDNVGYMVMGESVLTGYTPVKQPAFSVYGGS